MGSQLIAPGNEALWADRCATRPFRTWTALAPSGYRLASASIAGVTRGEAWLRHQGDGTFTEADLVGDGFVDIGVREGATVVPTSLSDVWQPCPHGHLREPELPVRVGRSWLFLNTLDCPSASRDPGTVPSTYTGQPWSNRKPPFVFFGKVGLNAGNFCTNTLQPPGIFQSWDLTGSDLFEFDDFLAPSGSSGGSTGSSDGTLVGLGSRSVFMEAPQGEWIASNALACAIRDS